MVKAGNPTKRYEDIGLYYDSDFGFRTIARQRTYKTVDGEAETPITALLLARKVMTGEKLPRAKAFEHRKVEACFANPANLTGETVLSVIVPYVPTDEVNHKAQIREIAAFKNVLSVSYFGETHTSSVERYTR